MKIIDTFLSIFIAGILSSTTVRGDNAKQEDLLLRLFEIGHNHGSADFYTSVDEQQSVEKLLKESCEKNGAGHNAYHTAKEGWEYFSNCNATGVHKMHHVIRAGQDLASILRDECAALAVSKGCVKRFKDSIEPCLDLEDRERMAILHNVMVSSIEFICDIDGARITKFFEDGGQRCLQSQRLGLSNCAKEFIKHYDPATSSDGKSATGEPNLFKLLDVQDCINMDKVQLCIVKVLNECEHHTQADIADALFNSIKKGLDCKKFRTSQASASSVVNIILMTTLMAILTRFG